MASLAGGLTAARPVPAARWRARNISLLTNGLPIVVGVIVALPLLLRLVNSFNVATPGQPAVFGVRDWVQAYSDTTAVRAFWYTLSLGVTRTAISLPIALTLAWLVGRTDMPGRTIIELLCWTG